MKQKYSLTAWFSLLLTNLDKSECQCKSGMPSVNSDTPDAKGNQSLPLFGIAPSAGIIYSEFLSVFTFLGTNTYLLLTLSLSNWLTTWHLCSKCLWDTQSKICSNNIHSPTRQSLLILWNTKKSNTLHFMTESCMENIVCMQRGQATISNPSLALQGIRLLLGLASQTHRTLMPLIFPVFSPKIFATWVERGEVHNNCRIDWRHDMISRSELRRKKRNNADLKF